MQFISKNITILATSTISVSGRRHIFTPHLKIYGKNMKIHLSWRKNSYVEGKIVPSTSHKNYPSEPGRIFSAESNNMTPAVMAGLRNAKPIFAHFRNLLNKQLTTVAVR